MIHDEDEQILLQQWPTLKYYVDAHYPINIRTNIKVLDFCNVCISTPILSRDILLGFNNLIELNLAGYEIETINEDVFSEFSYQELVKMIMTLPDGCRIIFNMYAIEGYKHHEIAEKLKISEGTSKSQYSRAKKLLIKMLESKNHIKYG